MKVLAVFFLLAASVFVNGLHRCPCQDTRKPEKDKQIFACAIDGTCDCGCEEREA